MGSAIRDAVAQSLSGRLDTTRKVQTKRTRSDGARSIPDDNDEQRKSMPDRVAEMLAEVTTTARVVKHQYSHYFLKAPTIFWKVRADISTH